MKEITKTIKLNRDLRLSFYNRKTAEIKLFVCPKYKGKQDVRIFIESIDDYALFLNKECHSDEEVELAYNALKVTFDSIPKVLTRQWCKENNFELY